MLPRLLPALLLALAACSAPPAPGSPDGGATPDGGQQGPQVGEVRVQLEPGTICLNCWELYAGGTRQLRALVLDTQGQALTDVAVTWSSADEAIAQVSPTGLVTARAAGEVAIRATAGGKTGEGQFTVLPAQVHSILVAPDQATIAVDATQQLTARAQDELGTEIQGVQFQWSSSNPEVATVDAAGLVTGVTPGAVIISASTLTGGNGWMALTVSGASTRQGFALTQTAAGIHHTCGRDAQGAAWCWGWNFFGQLGDGTRGDELDRFPIPVKVAGGHSFARLELGMYHSCALTAAGEAWCWGSGDVGQLGTHEQLREVGGTTVPFVVLGGHTFTQLALGGSHTCGLGEQNQTFCWGGNFDGQLGQGTTQDEPMPQPVGGGHVFQQIAAGWVSSCALDDQGLAWCWGSNGMGQLGDGRTPNDGTRAREPVAVLGGHHFTRLSLRSSHACALTAEGEAWCWGNNTFGQLGDATTEHRSQPVKVSTELRFKEITTGAHHSCGLTEAGAAWCWGNNDNAQFGNHTLTSSLFPTEVAGGHRFVGLTTGGSQTCAWTSSDETFCWGSAYTGEGGTVAGEGRSLVVPTPLAPPAP